MDTLGTLKTRCKAKIQEAFIKASKHYGVPVSTFECPIKFNNRLRTTAGRAATTGLTGQPISIELSTKILQENPEAFIRETPGHEAAHIISSALFGAKEGGGHGMRWKEVMGVIGQEPQVYHTFAVKRTRQRRWEYDCGCREHAVATVTHNRIQRGEQSRTCKTCNQVLVFTGKEITPLGK